MKEIVENRLLDLRLNISYPYIMKNRIFHIGKALVFCDSIKRIRRSVFMGDMMTAKYFLTTKILYEDKYSIPR